MFVAKKRIICQIDVKYNTNILEEGENVTEKKKKRFHSTLICVGVNGMTKIYWATSDILSKKTTTLTCVKQYVDYTAHCA